MRVLVVNAGSSTLKVSVIGTSDELELDVTIDPWDGDPASDELRTTIADIPPVDAVGHRIVHGGAELRDAIVVTEEVEQKVVALTTLAPLHQTRAVAALHAARSVLPRAPHVACFDTGFHATMTPAARTYALPRAWRERWGLDRFGFHGLSHAWAARRGATVTGVSPDARIVTCHVGAGASVCAVVGGCSVDTTMGFTPLDGVVMATRSGAVDPGILLWLLRHGGLTADELADGVERHGGLAGLAGTGDMRAVLAARAEGDSEATLAVDVYAHRLAQGVASMATSARGVDLLVFTGGVGEHAPAIRAAVTARLELLGVAIDTARNEVIGGDADISLDTAPVRTAVVTAREDLEITRQVRALLLQT